MVMFLLHILLRKGKTSIPVSLPAIVSAAGTCPPDQDVTNKFLQDISAILPGVNTICGGTIGWRRVGYLDMTDPSQSCPSGLALKNYSTILRSCGRATGTSGCSSTLYDTGGSQYSRVCGRVRGYQFGATAAFLAAAGGSDSDSYYVDGVSLTYGQIGSRTHIWTFAAGLADVRFQNEHNTWFTFVVA